MTKQVRQAITPTHILGSTGTAEGDDLGFRALSSFSSDLQGVGMYAQGNVLGTVSQSAGVPTGALIQQGSNVNGTFVRYADGTQICHLQVGLNEEIPVDSFFVYQDPDGRGWTFPVTFVSLPSVSVYGVCWRDNDVGRHHAIFLPRARFSSTAAGTGAFFAEGIVIKIDPTSGSTNASNRQRLFFTAVGKWF